MKIRELASYLKTSESMQVAGARWRIERHAAKEKSKKKLRLLMEVTRKLPKDEKDIERAAKSEVSQFTLRDLLLQKTRSESQRNELKLPKLNVVEFTEVSQISLLSFQDLNHFS